MLTWTNAVAVNAMVFVNHEPPDTTKVNAATTHHLIPVAGDECSHWPAASSQYLSGPISHGDCTRLELVA
ncbi:hypothetical protein QM646_16185, partial [Rhodococcus erythropolis]|nr:hypothetical protein [Rhodococcus erythropolis]